MHALLPHQAGQVNRFLLKGEVLACDGDGDRFSEVRFYRNGELIQTATTLPGPPAIPAEWNVVPETCIAVSFSDPSFDGEAYYYAIATQTDDSDGNGRNDEAISSPIWIR
jgi:hypothetical protein